MRNTDLATASILVVGANGSLARETIKYLIQDGVKEIVMGVRSEPKGLQAKKEILSATGKSDVQLEVVGGFDMNDPDQISGTVQLLSVDYSF